MAEKNLDFDTVIDRTHTNSLKYDFAVQRGKPKDVLPLWVADMDFQVSSYIQEALSGSVAHGIFGYSEAEGSYFEAVAGWMSRHYGWNVEETWLVKTPGIVFALAQAVRAFTEPGDAVLLQQPVYYPFSQVIRDNGRKIVDNTLVQGEDGRYRIDFTDFEEKIRSAHVKLFFLCNPHNPVGRVWTKEELLRLGDICERYGVIVVSDEIHADFVFEGSHQVLAGLKESYRKFVVTCTAPSKTFNLAGLQVSNIFIPDDALRRKFEQAVGASGYSQLNTMGLVACETAYRHGEEWYEAVKAYIRENLTYAQYFLEDQIPQVKAVEPEGRVQLSHKELLGTWAQNAELYLPGETVAGVIRSVEDYGVFVELTPNLAGLAEPCEGVRAGQHAGVYIKSILPEKMKIKLIIVDAFDAPYAPQPVQYFLTEGVLRRWRYSPPECSRVVETVFGE